MTKLRAGGYIRKSREGDNSIAYRVEAQKRLLPEYARSQGWSYSEFDEAFASASKENLCNLEARNRLETEIRAGNIDVVLVIELSRLSRDDSMEDYVSWLTLCAEKNVLLATPSRTLSPAEPSDWMLLLIEGGFSSTEMKILKKRMKEGRQEAFLKGSFLGGTPPAPYKYDSELRRVVIDEAALPLYKKIWRLAEVQSAKATSEQLGIPYTNVRRAIRDDRLDFFQAIRRNPQTEEIIRCAWEPVMTADEAARIRAARRTRVTNGNSTKPKALLSGLDMLKCGYCGRTVKTWSNGKPRKDKTKLKYYGCNTYNARNSCTKSRVLPQVVLDERVLTNVFNTISCLEDLMSHWLATQGCADFEKQIKGLEVEERNLLKQLDLLLDNFFSKDFPVELLNKKKTHLNSALVDIRNEQQSLRSRQTVVPDWDSLLLTQEEFECLDFIDRRRFLSLILEEVKVYETYAILIYKFPRDGSGNRTARIHLPEPRRGTAKGRSPLYKGV